MPDFEIVTREDYSDVTYMLEVRHPQMARAAKPGQFVIVMAHAQGERIPLTIADFDRERGTITLVIQAVGKTTLEMQRDLQLGTHLHAMVGPMGVPSHLGTTSGHPARWSAWAAAWAWRRSFRRPAPTRRRAPT
jgi:NAD(P)H-flavin reductase